MYATYILLCVHSDEEKVLSAVCSELVWERKSNQIKRKPHNRDSTEYDKTQPSTKPHHHHQSVNLLLCSIQQLSSKLNCHPGYQTVELLNALLLFARTLRL